MDNYFVPSSAGDWVPHPRFQGAFVRHLIQANANVGLTAACVRLMPGAELPVHHHPRSTETFYILSGKVTCQVGDREELMGPGDLGFAPPGVDHCVRNQADQPAEALSFFNPPLD